MAVELIRRAYHRPESLWQRHSCKGAVSKRWFWLFNATLAAWFLVAVLAAVISGCWMALIVPPAAALLFMTGRAERLTQTMATGVAGDVASGTTFALSA